MIAKFTLYLSTSFIAQYYSSIHDHLVYANCCLNRRPLVPLTAPGCRKLQLSCFSYLCTIYLAIFAEQLNNKPALGSLSKFCVNGLYKTYEKLKIVFAEMVSLNTENTIK